VRYFVAIEDEADTSGIEMMYIQGVHDVLNMVDLCKCEDAFDLAALQLHDKLGNHDGLQVNNILKREVERYVPSRVFDTVEREAVISSVAQRHAELVGYTAQEARLEYLAIVRELPSYGSSYFLVNSSGLPGCGSRGSKEVVVAITPKGLFVIDNYTKEYIENYFFENILTWGHSPTQFILATGTVANKHTVSFKCSSGKEMNDMMSVYVAAAVPKRN
jgi:myosin XV